MKVDERSGLKAMDGNGQEKSARFVHRVRGQPRTRPDGAIWQIYEGFAMDTGYTRDEYISELYDRMKHDKKFRPVVKKLAEQGDAECVEAMVLWNAHVKRLRREYASQR
jgi:hypothetical protein